MDGGVSLEGDVIEGVPGRYWHLLDDGRIQCDLCPRLCKLKDGQRAFCFVRKRVGDALDCWRVEAIEPDRLLRLRAEMKVPGRAWLQFEVEERAEGHSRIRQTAVFDPVGLAGLAYWYGIYPIHALVFRSMIRAIGRAASRNA